MDNQQIMALKRECKSLNGKRFKRYLQIKIEEIKGNQLLLSVVLNDATLQLLAKESFPLMDHDALVKRDNNQNVVLDEDHYLMTLIAFAATDIRAYIQESLHKKNIRIALNDNSRLMDIYTISDRHNKIMIKVLYEIDSLKIGDERIDVYSINRIRL